MNYKIGRKIVCAFVVLSFVISSSIHGFAEKRESGLTGNDRKTIVTSEVEKFTDDFLKKSMASNYVPGAVVVVVKDGKLLFKKGYGYSDINAKTGVDPDQTLFHIGSVGKLFTQTAAMQLYERGKLKLKDDINHYLGDIKIKSPYSNVVTVENLLTHTDGFEESSFVGSAARTFETKVSYETFIRNNIPYVVENPGTAAHYTNIGTDILGYIVQKVAGVPYTEYIEQNIFKPLKMDSSKVAPKIIPKGYIYQRGHYELCPNGFSNGVGSGDIISTGKDMTNFMLAHLQAGRIDSGSILKSETAEDMHKLHFTNNAKMPGMAYGFYEAKQNGLRIIKHDGAVQGFISTLFLIPEEGVGVFISTNSTGSEAKVNSLTFDYETEFVNHFYPQQGETQITPTECTAYCKKLVGTYRNYDNTSKARISKLAALFPPGFDSNIFIDKDNHLVLAGQDITGRSIHTKLSEVEPYLFQRMDNGSLISFKTDGEGKATYLFRDEPFDSYGRIRFYEGMTFNLVLLGVCLLFFLIFMLMGGIKVFKILLRKQKLMLLGKNLDMLLAGMICLLDFSGIIGIFISSMLNYWEFQFAMPKAIYFFLIELILAGLCTFALLIRIIITARKPDIRLRRKILLSSVVFISILFSLFAAQWNLIGFKW